MSTEAMPGSIPNQSLLPNQLEIELGQATQKLLVESTDLAQKVYRVAKIAFHAFTNAVSTIFQRVQRHIETINLAHTIQEVNKLFTDAEKIFNIVACIPILGVLSSTVRGFLGQVQALCGVGIAAISEVGKLMTSNKGEEYHLKQKWEVLSQFGLEFAVHGCLNTLRGTFEAGIGTYTLGMGNILLLVPNMANNRNFNPYLPYGIITNKA